MRILRRNKHRQRIDFKYWCIIAVVLLPLSMLWSRINQLLPNIVVKIVLNILIYLTIVMICTVFLSNIMKAKRNKSLNR